MGHKTTEPLKKESRVAEETARKIVIISKSLFTVPGIGFFYKKGEDWVMLKTNFKNKAFWFWFIFALTVLLSPNSSFAANVMLSWTPPTTNIDGTPLTDLLGYKIYWGESSGNYTQSIDVGNTTNYKITNLTAGSTYYFVTTAYDMSGNESSPSNEISKTVTDCDDQGVRVCAPSINVSKTLISEDFSNGIPVSWSKLGAWNSDNTCGQTIDYPFITPFAIADSSCAVTENDELITSSFDASGCSNVGLAFNSQNYMLYGNVDVKISSDGGTNWAEAGSIPLNDGYPDPNWKNIDINGVSGASDAKIKFNYVNSTPHGFWAIDNVWVTCQPNNLAFSSPVMIPSSTQSIVISNTGNTPLSIDSIFIDGHNASEFSFKDDNGCSTKTMQSSETCVFDIGFLPDSLGSKSAALSIRSNDPGTPVFTIPLTGTATEMVKPVAKVKVNGSDGYIQLKKGRVAEMTLEIDPQSYKDADVEWGLLLIRTSNNRWYYYNPLTEKWSSKRSVYDRKPLSKTEVIEIMKTSNLPKGSYNLYFGVDTKVNGAIEFEQYYYDVMSVKIDK